VCTAYPRLVKLIGYTTGISEDNFPVTCNQKEEQCVERHKQNDTAPWLDFPQRDSRKKHEAMINQWNDHEHNDGYKKQTTCPNLITPLVRHDAELPPFPTELFLSENAELEETGASSYFRFFQV
jgi:hypothetical protein